MIDGHLHLAYVRVLVVPGQHLERVLTVTSSTYFQILVYVQILVVGVI